MGLHLIVDGYNLIRASDSLSRQESISLADGREALLERLAAYKRIKQWPVTVVFDGADGPGLNYRPAQIKGIKVIFSRLGQIADQVIENLVKQKGAQAVVVTSDRALAAACTAAGATILDSLEFEARLEMAFLSEIKGVGPEDEDLTPTLSTRKKGPRKRKPKADRRRAAKLRKL